MLMCHDPHFDVVFVERLISATDASFNDPDAKNSVSPKQYVTQSLHWESCDNKRDGYANGDGDGDGMVMDAYFSL